MKELEGMVPASEWGKALGIDTTQGVFHRWLRERVKGAKFLYNRWWVPEGSPDPRRRRGAPGHLLSPEARREVMRRVRKGLPVKNTAKKRR